MLAHRRGAALRRQDLAGYRPTGRTVLLHMSTSGPTTDIVLDELAISGRVVAYHVPAPGRQQLDFVRSFDGRSGARLRRSAKFRRHRTAGCAVQRVAVATYSRGAIVWLANGVLRALDSRGSRAGGSDGAAGS